MSYAISTIGALGELPALPAAGGSMVEACGPFCPPPVADRTTLIVVGVASAAFAALLTWALVRR